MSNAQNIAHKSSPNGDTDKRLQQVEHKTTRMEAEKLGWWRAAIAMSAVVVTMFSALVTVTVYLDGKIEAGRAEQQQTRIELMEEIAEIKINQARFDERQIRIEENQAETREIAKENSRKLDMILRQNRAILGDSDPTINETPVDAPANAPYTAPNAASNSDAPSSGTASEFTPITPINTNTNTNTPTNPININPMEI